MVYESKSIEKLENYLSGIGMSTNKSQIIGNFIENSRDIAEMAVLHEKMFEMWSHAKISKGGNFLIHHLQEKGQQSDEENVII